MVAELEDKVAQFNTELSRLDCEHQKCPKKEKILETQINTLRSQFSMEDIKLKNAEK